MRIKVIVTLLFVLLSETIRSDSQLVKGPAAYNCRDSEYIAEIFPSGSRLKNKEPFCFFYRQNFRVSKDEDYNAARRFSLVWSGKLVNTTAPNAALVSTNGYLVTLDEHAFLGSNHSIVIYDKNGKMIQDYSLKEVIPDPDIKSQLDKSTSSIWWRNNAKYYFTNPASPRQSLSNPSHLYILLKHNFVIEIKLESGINSSGKLNKYRHLDSLVNHKYVNEEHLVWNTDLEYSSITELLNCLNNR